MTTLRNTFPAGVALALAVLTLAPLAPASADSLEVSDARDLDHGVDLRSVTVRHKASNVVVTTTHTDLRRSFRSGSSGAVFLDTDPGDTGPEYVLVGGYFVGTDYALLTTEGFARSAIGEPVGGSYDMRIDFDADRVRMRISREALGSPEQVRVAVRVAGTRPDGGNTRTDWLIGPRTFTEWVAQ